MKRNIFLVFFILVSSLLTAQMEEHVKWTTELKPLNDGQYEIVFSTEIDPGWHVYNLTLPEGGPVATTLNIEEIKGAELVGPLKSDEKPIVKHDANFDMELSWFETAVTLKQVLKVTDANSFIIKGYLEYMSCNDESCMPPTPVDFSYKGDQLKSNAPAPEQVKPEEAAGADAGVFTPATPVSDSEIVNSLWQPVTTELNALGNINIGNETSLWIIFITGFAGGLLALLTPCVWPMIPMTVSFFLKRTKNRKKSIRDAMIYGASIIVIYLVLGLLITMIFGASALNSLSTNAVFNLLFFALLLLFAISFFGAFELTLPEKWTTKLDRKADTTTGFISIFFMAFTLALVSFSCTGPIIGTLLVQAASLGATAGPAIGMFGFALALSVPFSLFAIFPSWLQQMPKSGGWLNLVKVVLGFLELALALKFLSVADLAYGWRILDREIFLVLWIVIFALLGMYLLGKLKFSHDSDLPYTSVPRLFMAIISFGFAVYMLPGLWGAPLKSISAFAPPLYTQDFNLYKGEVHAQFSNYEAGMAYAKLVKKPIMIDFSGHGCVNCRKMEAAVWTDPKVKQIIENDYVLITLMVDDKTPLPEKITVDENGKQRTLRTVGDKWSYLQRYKFGANAQPYYVLLDDQGKPLAPSYAYDENIDKYISFLESGINRFKNK